MLYLFGSLGILSSICVVITVNPVHSVLFLILTFVLSTGIMFLLNLEFLAIVFIVVYVGAIAVLFLFVVMMLNIRIIELTESFLRYLPLSGLVGITLVLEIYYVIVGNLGNINYIEGRSWLNELNRVSNMEGLSEGIYTYNAYAFMLAGGVLLVAMIGTIVLTLSHKADVRRQYIYRQVGANFKKRVFNKIVE